MDYLSILLEGYLDENSRRHLDKYYFRKWKEAEKEHYTAIEFFEGCLHEIHKLENKIQQQVESRKLQLKNYIQMSSNSENIKIWEKELEKIPQHWKTSYTVSLPELTNQKYNGGLSWAEIQSIKEKINLIIQAKEKNDNKDVPEEISLNEFTLKTNCKNTKFLKTPTIEEDIENAIKIINPLKGYWNRNRIMRENDFNRLVEYIELILKEQPLPKKLFPTTGAPNIFISKTIYEVYRHTGKKHREQFINLVHLFRQFEKTEQTTTKKKFSFYPSNYETDIKTQITF